MIQVVAGEVVVVDEGEAEDGVEDVVVPMVIITTIKQSKAINRTMIKGNNMIITKKTKVIMAKKIMMNVS